MQMRQRHAYVSTQNSMQIKSFLSQSHIQSGSMIRALNIVSTSGIAPFIYFGF